MLNISRQYKKLFFIPAFIAIGLLSCHSNDKKDTPPISTNADTSVPTRTEAPVIVASDDSLQSGIKDALKDYPGVKATSSNGEITLTGEIPRSKLQGLMMSLNSLHPKKVNNNLTIK